MTTDVSGRGTPVFLVESSCSIVNRFSAKAIDLIVVSALFLLGQALLPLLGVALGAAFCALQDGMGSGQSVGKRIIGLCVIDASGGYPCSFRASIWRNLPFVLCIIMLSYPILWVFLCVLALPMVVFEIYLLFNLPSGVRVGDVVANTKVIERVDESLPEFQNS